MSYDPKDLLRQAIDVVNKNKNVYFIEDIVAFLPCSKSTFYKHLPEGSDELNDLKEVLTKNKTAKKVEIRGKLLRSEKAAELLALYRLICTPEERKMLNQSYIDHTSDDKPIKSINVNIIGD